MLIGFRGWWNYSGHFTLNGSNIEARQESGVKQVLLDANEHLTFQSDEDLQMHHQSSSALNHTEKNFTQADEKESLAQVRLIVGNHSFPHLCI